MNLSICISTILLLTILSGQPTASAASPADSDDEMKRVEALNKALSKGGIAELLSFAQTNSLQCPLIASRYLADRTATRNATLARLEHAKRDFGLNLAKALDNTASELQLQAAPKKRATQAEEIFTLANWIKLAKATAIIF